MRSKLFPIPWPTIEHWSIAQQTALQEKRLQEFMYLLNVSSFYNSFFRVHSINPSKIKTINDLAKLPFTSKKDLIPSREHPEKPSTFVLDPTNEMKSVVSGFELMFSKKLKDDLIFEFKPVDAHFTAGRSAPSIPVFYTQYDLIHMEEAAMRMMRYLKMPHTVRIVNLYPSSPQLPFWYTVYATKHLGIFCLQTGKILNTKRILDNIERMQAEVLVGMPSYIYYLISKAVEEKRKLSGIQLLILSGEGMTIKYINKIKHLLSLCDADNVSVYTTYGFAEGKVLWTQCHEDSGYHLYPDMEIIEIIDESGNRVPDGQSGEIVYTGIGFRGTAFLRYKTGDIGRMQVGACQYCGAKTPLLEPAIIRTSDIIPLQLTKVKETYVDFNALAALLSSIEFIQQWHIILKKHKGVDVVEAETVLAPGIEQSYAKNEIVREVKSRFGFAPEIIFIKEETLLHQIRLENTMIEKKISDRRH